MWTNCSSILAVWTNVAQGPLVLLEAGGDLGPHRAGGELGPPRAGGTLVRVVAGGPLSSRGGGPWSLSRRGALVLVVGRNLALVAGVRRGGDTSVLVVAGEY